MVISEIRHPEELSLCKPLDIEHLKFNYGEVRQAEEKKRRVTLAAMPSHCQRREGYSNQDNSDRVRLEALCRDISFSRSAGSFYLDFY